MKRTVLITGASGNLGAGVMQKFLEEDFQIAALDSPRSATRIKESAQVRSFPVDLMDEQGVGEVVEKVFSFFESIEMAVLTVGGFAMGDIEKTGLDDFDKMYRLNFVTAYTVARQLYLRMRDQDGGGQLVFIGSRPALHPDQAKNLIAYSLTKSLVFRLAEVINEEGREVNVGARVVIPSIIDTPQNRSAMPDADFSKWVSPLQIAEKIHQLTTVAGRKQGESIIEIYGDS
jgi:NAD(P)-dependent dehydrogenase (short-subunit alcohol dehydrogenase family)